MIVHSGYTIDADGTQTQHVTDCLDALPCELRGYRATDFTLDVPAFTDAIRKTEAQGWKVQVQIDGLTYDTDGELSTAGGTGRGTR